VTSRPPPPTPPDIRVRIRRFGWSKQAQINTSGLPGFIQAGRYRHFTNCCIMPLRTCSFITTTIYPNHSAGDRSGLHRGESSPHCGARFLRLLCHLLTSATRSSPLTVRSVHYWTRGGSPEVNTHLSAHERRVYMPGL